MVLLRLLMALISMSTKEKRWASSGNRGSGKSVTSLAILRLLDPKGKIEEGSEIIFNGKNLLTLTEDEMRRIRGNDIAMIS